MRYFRVDWDLITQFQKLISILTDIDYFLSIYCFMVANGKKGSDGGVA